MLAFFKTLYDNVVVLKNKIKIIDLDTKNWSVFSKLKRLYILDICEMLWF
ncbi:hypothetical protein J2W95_003531 [Flavobacterium granuli]|uniref:Uncharacterized protein n=1 Tax=Flavobacterium granuli TaxID=280093 RepID=A0ABU1S728_9FLAO|nr:hypothetical protein [Flavobacterium granuli]